jgi:hypothetical protein
MSKNLALKSPSGTLDRCLEFENWWILDRILEFKVTHVSCVTLGWDSGPHSLESKVTHVNRVTVTGSVPRRLEVAISETKISAHQILSARNWVFVELLVLLSAVLCWHPVDLHPDSIITVTTVSDHLGNFGTEVRLASTSHLVKATCNLFASQLIQFVDTLSISHLNRHWVRNITNSIVRHSMALLNSPISGRA